jgi:pyruvate/2-oxoglutarate dehydrogenase complex dihydrolipoamide dehydrogenase (E3) component
MERLAFARLGSNVTVIEAGPTFLGLEEPEAVAALRPHLEADGIMLMIGDPCIGVERPLMGPSRERSAVVVHLNSGATVRADGQVVARRLPGIDARVDHTAVPRVTFTDPEIASVGLSEAAARARGIDVVVARADPARPREGYIHDFQPGRAEAGRRPRARGADRRDPAHSACGRDPGRARREGGATRRGAIVMPLTIKLRRSQ